VFLEEFWIRSHPPTAVGQPLADRSQEFLGPRQKEGAVLVAMIENDLSFVAPCPFARRNGTQWYVA
jgi:hypothetical protein